MVSCQIGFPPDIRSTGRDRGSQTGGWLAGRGKRRVADLRANERAMIYARWDAEYVGR